MLPMDGEAAVMIPAGNMREDVPGTYAWMKKMYAEAKARSIQMSPGGGSFCF